MRNWGSGMLMQLGYTGGSDGILAIWLKSTLRTAQVQQVYSNFCRSQISEHLLHTYSVQGLDLGPRATDIYSYFNKYSLSMCYVPDTVLGFKDVAANRGKKTHNKSLPLGSLHSSGRTQTKISTINKWSIYYCIWW